MYSSKFTFTRLRYKSGDWDTDQRMPSNILNSLVRIHYHSDKSGGKSY